MDLKLRKTHVVHATTSAIALAALTVCTPALAQDDGPGYAIEEITVTAQKREENLQETPMAITALTAAGIEDRGIKGVQDLFTTTPGMVGYEAPASRGNIGVSMRGIGSGNASNISLDPANGMYVDGVYLGKAIGLGVDQGDLERIEILRGPQGTLYGRNSTGGAINFITRKPSGELGISAQVTGGNHGLKEYKGRLDLPAIGDLLLSVSANSRERDHLYGNTNSSLPGFDSIDRQGFRFAARWQPSDNFTLDYSYDSSEMDEETTVQHVVGFNPLGFSNFSAPNLSGQPGFADNLNIRSNDRLVDVATVQQFLPFLGPLFLAPQVQDLNQWMTDYQVWAGGVLSRGSSRQGLVGSSDATTRSANEVDGHALTLTWDVEDAGVWGDIEFKSITGWRETEGVNDADLDGIDNSVTRPGGAGTPSTGIVSEITLTNLAGLYLSGNPTFIGVANGLIDSVNNRGRAETFNTYSEREYEQFSQELQMVGTTDTVDYAVGLFYFDDEGARLNNSTPTFPFAWSDSTSYTNGTTAWSIYSQVTWLPSVESRFSLTGGLRYTEEEKEVTYRWRTLESPFSIFAPAETRYGPNDRESILAYPETAGIFGRQFEEDFDNLSGKITLAYNFTDTINGFATFSTGYRSGGFNGDAFDEFNDTADAFNEETIENFEIGFKSDLWDGRMRLNGTYFAYTYDDQQVSTLQANADGTVTSNTDNSGSADRSGLEVEFTVLPIEDLQVSLNYTLMDGDFEEFPPTIAENGAVLQTSNLARRSLLPDNQISWNIDWTIAELGSGLLQLNLNGQWQQDANSIAINTDSYDTTGDGSSDTPVVWEQPRNDERTIVNARLALNEIAVGDGALSVGLWGRNLTDDDYRTFSFNYGPALGLVLAQYGEESTYGVDLIYRY
jgi:iron complex outermembrane receptor protein